MSRLRATLMASLRSLGINPDQPNPGRTLSNIGHEQRREKVKAKARQMRREMGMAPAEALQP